MYRFVRVDSGSGRGKVVPHSIVDFYPPSDCIMDNMNTSMMSATVTDNLSISNTPGAVGYSTCWDYWSTGYYPQVIHTSYPVYLQERAKDKGKQAFEIIKVLKDKKLVSMTKVGDFIDLMDELIKIL